MSRQFLKLPLGLATLLCLGAVAAQPAHAGVSINSISGIPEVVPAAGAAIPVLIDCGGVTTAPTGSATVTNSSGKVISWNSLYSYQTDANGNPVVFSFLAFPGNADPAADATYTVTLTLTDASGGNAVRSFTVTQGFMRPIEIKSVTPSPSVLQATDQTVSVSVGLSYGGANQGSYVRGEAILKDAAGKWLEEETLSGPEGTDSNGNPAVATTFSQVPANGSASTQNYTITVLVQDNTGAWTYGGTSVSQLAVAGAVTTQSSVATLMTVTNPTGKTGQTIHLVAQLRRSADHASLSGKTLTFSVDGAAVGTAFTNASGLASLTYKVSAALAPGSHTVTASFAGDSASASSFKAGTLTVTH